MRRIILIILFSLSCASLVSLGVWQLDRAEQKRIRHATYLERRAAVPLDFAQLPSKTNLAEVLWRRARMSGHYIDNHVVLDNRLQHRRAGYEVLTPFATDDGRVVLVDRGWIPLGASRSALPDVLAPADPLTLTGHIGAEPVVGIELDEANYDAELLAPEIVRVQRIDLVALSGLIQNELWPAVFYLDAAAPGALEIDWPTPGDGSAKHTAYAVQWFAMAAILAGIGLWKWTRRPTDHV